MDNMERFSEWRYQLLACAQAGQEDIHVVLNSPGGFVEPTMALIDLMQAIPNKIIGLAAGECHSSAITLLQGCDLRLSLPNSQFLVHLVYNEMSGVSPSLNSRLTVQAQLDQMNQSFERVVALYAQRSGRSADDMRVLMNEGDVTGVPVFAEAILAAGLIDEIVVIPPLSPFGAKASK